MARKRYSDEDVLNLLRRIELEPELGFVEMAAGMGLIGVRVSEPEALAAAAGGEAWVIEVVVEGKR